VETEVVTRGEEALRYMFVTIVIISFFEWATLMYNGDFHSFPDVTKQLKEAIPAITPIQAHDFALRIDAKVRICNVCMHGPARAHNTSL